MAFEFKFPDVGEGIHEGEIVKWRVKVGDEIKEDQPLVEMETAKAIVELPSPKSGLVLALVGKEGEVVHVGAVLVVVGEKGEKWTPPAVETQKTAPAESAAKSSPGVIGQIPTEEKGVVLPPRRPENSAPKPEWPKQSPEMLRQAQHDIFPGPIERIPLKSVRKAIAENMVKSVSTIPHVTHFDEIDASALVKLRAGKKAEAEKQNIKLTYLAFIVQAVVETLKKHQLLNAFFNDAGAATKEIIIKKYYNIGIAVDTEEGLMVPVIKDADKKDVFAIAKEIADLAEKARSRKLSIEDLKGASFSVTNVGSIGGNAATPIIAFGQSANLAVMKMKNRPIAVDGKIEIRPILPLCLAFDHRVLDGADAARFMNDLVKQLASP